MNRVQLLIFGTIGLLVVIALALATGVIPGLKEQAPAPFTLTVWGPRNDPELWQTIAQAYRQEAVESATIEYARKDPGTYEAELVNALAAGRGPDIFLATDAMLERHRDKISPLAEGALGYRRQDLRRAFADGVVGALLTDDGSLLGTPLSLDTLALFYNRDRFNAANLPQPPETWEALTDQVRTLTRLSAVGGIQRSGAALGTAANVDHAGDILAALIYQSGGTFIDPGGRSDIDNPLTLKALAFYTSFAEPTKNAYSWNAFFQPSLRAFAAGETAMAVGYAADVPIVAAANPQLNFDTAPFPQPSAADTPVTLGRLGLAVVSRTSGEQEQTWRFLLWLQGRDTQKVYADAVGLPSARRDLVSSKPPRSYLQPFYDQVLTAKTLPPALAGSLGRILGDMIGGVATRRFSAEQAANRASVEINAILNPQP